MHMTNASSLQLPPASVIDTYGPIGESVTLSRCWEREVESVIPAQGYLGRRRFQDHHRGSDMGTPLSFVDRSIFICYRRDDARYAADILEDAMRLRFGDAAVFRDLRRIAAGVAVDLEIEQALAACVVGIVIIGARWLSLKSADGSRRIDGELDWVRLEVSALLSRSDRRVIPVYVDEASQLKSSELPPGLAALAGLNARRLRHGEDLKTDLGRILSDVESALATATEPIVPRDRLAPRTQGLAMPAVKEKGPEPPPKASQESILSQLLGYFKASNAPVDLGLSLGRKHITISYRPLGIILREPSLVALSRGTQRVVGIGEEAESALDRPSVFGLHPIAYGVIEDFKVAETLLRKCLEKVLREHGWTKPRVIATVPCGATGVERDALYRAVISAGASSVYLIQEPLSACIGAGVPLKGHNMVICIGDVTDVAVISGFDIVFSRSSRIGGDQLDDAIVQYMKRAYNLVIDKKIAEWTKNTIGSVYPIEKETSCEIRGYDLVAGLPKTITLQSQEAREALLEPVSTMMDCIRSALEQCSPKVSADLVDRGLILVGEAAALRGFDRLVMEKTGLPVLIADAPVDASVLGAANAFREIPPSRLRRGN